MYPNYREAFRFRRHELGFSQKRMAQLIGVTTSTIYRYELGAKIPDKQHSLILAWMGHTPVFKEQRAHKLFLTLELTEEQFRILCDFLKTKEIVSC